MAYRVSPTAVQVISSGLPGEGWTPMPADSILAIDLASRQIDVFEPAAFPTVR